MFARISPLTLVVLALPLLVASSVVPRQETNTTVTGGQCNTGSAQCCKSVQDSILEAQVRCCPELDSNQSLLSGGTGSSLVQNTLGLLGIPIGDITAQVYRVLPVLLNLFDGYGAY
ncbi:hypothetical protein ARMSODRAFT_1001558 [Armillaria solidipes]|uniref:Hydrophobin n=1 Tax=Armillaria solidipes TaxID=1076256 RepID=A0A2H3BWV5_9AGAR|nr:hypothetical protein ARMSODRAFT_1001558 [Armillaria solidipes]